MCRSTAEKAAGQIVASFERTNMPAEVAFLNLSPGLGLTEPIEPHRSEGLFSVSASSMGFLGIRWLPIPIRAQTESH